MTKDNLLGFFTTEFRNTITVPKNHAMVKLVLLRHGQSQWNLENRFTGWVDVDLTEKGENEAKEAGELMRDAGIEPAMAYTSVLARAIRTLWIALREIDRTWIPEVKDWRLNERHYGALTGMNKSEIAEKYGEDKVHAWRRSYDVPPPALDKDDQRHPKHDPRYQHVDPGKLPLTESLELTLDRVLPCWNEEIVPALSRHGTLLISAHGNSLRALVKHLDNMSGDEIARTEIPTGKPLVYELSDSDFSVLDRYYLHEQSST